MADRRTKFRKDTAKVKRDAANESRQLMNRLKQMTPAQTNAEPSPALMAWNAIRTACTDDAQ